MRAVAPLRGRFGRLPARAHVEVLRWVSGWAALAWIGRLLAGVTGFARRGEVWIEGETVLRVRRETAFWGKVVRQADEAYPLASVAGVRRQVRHPALRLGVAAVAFGVGALAASVLLLDGIRTGTGALVALAGIALAAGAGLDVALCAWLPTARGRVGVEIDLAPRSGVRLRGVDASAAEAFVAQVTHRLAAR